MPAAFALALAFLAPLSRGGGGAPSTADRDATAAERSSSDREPLVVGACAYNRSDRRLVGRVLSVGPLGTATAGRSIPGERVLTVRLTRELRDALGTATDEFTYPRNVTVEPCP